MQTSVKDVLQVTQDMYDDEFSYEPGRLENAKKEDQELWYGVNCIADASMF